MGSHITLDRTLTAVGGAVKGVRVTIDPAEPRATIDPADQAAESIASLERAATDAVRLLAARPDPDAFQALLRLSALVGESLGTNARALATNGSWARVAEVAGTTRQAAWSRWSS
jgi:hypothetical protein